MDRDDVTIRAARSEDYGAVAELLGRSRLTLEGLLDHFSGARVAVGGEGAVVGCVALEVYGEVALLRSLAVDERLRGQGHGERLVEEILEAARASGVRDVYLLTETAASFFPRFGFRQEGRSLAPADLQASAEFQFACPSSAVLMHFRLRTGSPSEAAPGGV